MITTIVGGARVVDYVSIFVDRWARPIPFCVGFVGRAFLLCFQWGGGISGLWRVCGVRAARGRSSFVKRVFRDRAFYCWRAQGRGYLYLWWSLRLYCVLLRANDFICDRERFFWVFSRVLGFTLLTLKLFLGSISFTRANFLAADLTFNLFPRARAKGSFKRMRP